MAVYRFYLIGAQLLLLSHMAQSFILLTANMEDVKKIARKFVSDSLAEKIAEFVVKATEQMVANVSEENDQNADEFQNLSNDNYKLANIGRQRYEKATRTVKDFDLSKKYEASEKKIIKQYEKTSTSPNDWTIDTQNTEQAVNWEKELRQNSNEKSKDAENEQPLDNAQLDYEHAKLEYEQLKPEQQKVKYEQTKSEYEQQKPEYEQQNLEYELPKIVYKHQNLEYEQPKVQYEQPKVQYEQPKTEYEKSNNLRKPKSRLNIKNHQVNLKESRRPPVIANQDIKYNKQNHPKPRHVVTLRPNIDSTILYNDKLLHGDMSAFGPSKKKMPNVRGHRLSSNTEAKQYETRPAENQTVLPSGLRGFNVPKELTTKKERTAFDQYDNPNYPRYPKQDFIATSGPVSLPKVEVKTPWWEKELPKQTGKEKESSF